MDLFDFSIDPARLELFCAGQATWGKSKPLDLWMLSADELRTALEALLDQPQPPAGEVQ
ncbi:hypothetical protein VMT65_07510 [Nocardia sp. CDC153]|uniref:hypothetical protein n=1 Tax=Nocardia sp. CDC153 TaxID=3112167 RepID=UPI002DBAB3AC|nr:hypothetical protein [Nocardia sp. CDC153]MEC3952872.1 hypothetical protein [Nocardia sp. CDC153]